MKEIMLSGGKVALVDDGDFEYLNQWKWFASRSKNNCYARRAYYPSGRNGPHIKYSMHRVIFEHNGLDIENKQLDHINGNGLDNQKSNLRVATNTQNCHNRTHIKASDTPYKGIWYRSEIGKWRSRIKVDGKFLLLGHFDTKEDAARAYNVAAIKYFGEFAKLNDVPGGPEGLPSIKAVLSGLLKVPSL